MPVNDGVEHGGWQRGGMDPEEDAACLGGSAFFQEVPPSEAQPAPRVPPSEPAASVL